MRTAIDLICGMTVETDKAADRADFDGITYYFCSKQCGMKFWTNPKHFLAHSGREDHGHGGSDGPHVHHVSSPGITATDSLATYICPMHPEVRQVGPGNCPNCGMALEPQQV